MGNNIEEGVPIDARSEFEYLASSFLILPLRTKPNPYLHSTPAHVCPPSARRRCCRRQALEASTILHVPLAKLCSSERGEKPLAL